MKPAPVAIITELTEIATTIERTRTMSERTRIAIYTVLESVEDLGNGNKRIRSLKNFSTAIDELNRIIDEVRPRTSGEWK